MSFEVPLDSDLWSPSLARQLDAACNRFEADWRNGHRPRIEDYLHATPTLPRAELLRELLALERAYRGQSGEAPTEDEYYRRFPEDSSLVRAVFREPSAGPDLPQQEKLGEDWPITLPDAGGRDRALLPGPSLGQGPSLAIPGYDVLGILGRGGMGIVYLAQHANLKRLVALKMILADAEVEQGQARFRLEAESVARLRHPNIVQIYEIGEHQGRTYLALEYVEGGSLEQKLNGTPLPPRQAAQLLEPLAGAIHHAHQNGIVHRDLKPANVLLASPGSFSGGSENRASEAPFFERPLNDAGVPKITDFGLAKQLGTDSGQTRSGAIVGTPNYMAPEQAEGNKQQIGPAADVYALGAILYECLTGRSPFRGATVLDTLALVRAQDPVPPSRLQPRVPRDLETICLKCLQKEPSRRYASAEALAEDLRAFLQGKPIQARRAPSWERLSKWVKRQPATAALLAVVTLALVGATAGVLLYQEKRARLAEHELRQLNQRDEKRRQIDTFVRQGQAHLLAQRWQEAQNEFDKALTIIAAEPPLADDRVTIEREREGAQEKLALEQARARAVEQRQQFDHWLNEARIHGTLLFSDGRLPRPQAARAAATRALGLYGLSPERASALVLPPTYLGPEKEAIRAGCYELLLLLAENEAQPGTPEQARRALRLLEAARPLGPEARAFHLRRARYLILAGDHDEARKEALRAWAIAPASALDFFVMGDEEQRRGTPQDVARAVRHFQSAVQRQPDHFWAQFFLAVCHLRQKQSALACGPLNVCLIRQPPDFPWAYLLRGYAHCQLKDWQAAEQDFQLARKQNPNEDARYEIALNLGTLRMLQKKHAEAVAELEQAIALRPGRHHAYTQLAEAYRRQGDLGLAIQQVGRGLKACRAGQLELYRCRARLHRERAEPDEALRDLQRAISASVGKSADLSEDHLQRGHILQQGKRHAEALAAYKAALLARPTIPEAHLGCARAALELRRYREAIRSLDDYLRPGEKGKESAEAYRLRGLARAWVDDPIGAIADYGRAIDRAPEARTYALRGWAFLFQGSLGLAEHDFDQALVRDGALRDAYAGRAYIHAKRGRHAQAVADVEKAVEGDEVEARTLCNGARALAEIVHQNTGPRGRQARELGRQCEQRGLELLRRALVARPRPERPELLRQIAADPVLRPLRASPGFARLATEFAGKPK